MIDQRLRDALAPTGTLRAGINLSNFLLVSARRTGRNAARQAPHVRNKTTGSGADAIIRKGTNPKVDSYSAFFENDKVTSTGLAGFLTGRGCDRLTMVGLATDYCVAWSALDGVAEGFEVTVLLSACRAIDLDGSLDAALTEMRQAGVTLLLDNG